MMKRSKDDPVRIDLIDLLARWAAQGKRPIRDDETISAFLEDVRKAAADRLSNDVYVYGKRTEAMFETVVASLGEVQLLKQEDMGLSYHTGPDIKVPDLRVVTKEGEQLLIEVKNHRVEEGFEPVRQKCEYLDKLARYSELVKAELLMAIYWSRWNRWSLVPIAAFVRTGQYATLSMTDAFLHDQMIRLGDRLIGTRAPLRLRMMVKPAPTQPVSAENGRVVTIMHVEILSEDRVLTDDSEKRLATFFLLEGGWQATTIVTKEEDGEYETLEIEMTPELHDGKPLNDQGFEFLDALSGMISRQFQGSTSAEGIVSAIRTEFKPGEIRRLLPDDRPTGGPLPLWIMHVQPKYGWRDTEEVENDEQRGRKKE